MAKVIWELATELTDDQQVKAISINKELKIRFKMSDDSAFINSSDGSEFANFLDQGDKSGSNIDSFFLSAEEFNMSLGFGGNMDAGNGWGLHFADIDNNASFTKQSIVQSQAHTFAIWDDEQMPFRAQYHKSTFNSNVFEPHLEATNYNILQSIEWEVEGYSAILTLPNLKACFPVVTDSPYVYTIQGITDEFIHATGTGTSDGGPWPGGGNHININQDQQTHPYDNEDYFGPNGILTQDWVDTYSEFWFDHENSAYVPTDQVLGSCIMIKWSFKLMKNLGGGSSSHALSRPVYSGYTSWTHDTQWNEHEFTKYWTIFRFVEEQDLNVYIDRVALPNNVIGGEIAEGTVEISSGDFIGNILVAFFDKNYLDIFGEDVVIEQVPGNTWIGEAEQLLGSINEDIVVNYGNIKFEDTQTSFTALTIGKNETMTLPFTYISETAHANAADRFAVVVKMTNIHQSEYQENQIVQFQWEGMSEIQKYQYSDNNIIEILEFDSDIGGEAYPSDNIITRPSDVMLNLINEELGYNKEIDYSSLENARNWHADWKMAFSVHSKTDSKKLIQEICQSTKLNATLSNDKLRFICLQDSYNDATVSTIDSTDIIRYNFDRTSLDEVKTQVEVKYHYDYGLKEYTRTTGEIKVGLDYLKDRYSLNGTYKDYESSQLQSINYYGLEINESTQEINHINTYLVHECKYIRDEQTAIELAYSILKERCNQHNIVEITLPIKYYYFELGDIIRFSELIEGQKIYGEDYVVNDNDTLPIRCGQYILPYFIITSISKSLNSVAITAYQLHHLSNDRLVLNNRQLDSYGNIDPSQNDQVEGIVGDINNDGYVDVLDVVQIVQHIVSGPGSGSQLSGQALLRADFNGDGVVNILDVVPMVASIVEGEVQRGNYGDQSTEIMSLAPSYNTKIIETEDEIILKANGEIAAFEFSYSGMFNGNNKLPPGWSIKVGKNKIVAWSMAQSPIASDSVIFKFSGTLSILSAKYVTWDSTLRYAQIVKKQGYSWLAARNKWSSESRKFEVIKPKFYNKKIRKSTI